MQPFEDELKGNPSIEMMKQVVIAGKKRPEFPMAFNVNPVSYCNINVVLLNSIKHSNTFR